MPELRPNARVAMLIAVMAVVAMLYLGQEFLKPLALSILIAFLLAPIVVRLESWGLGRATAVVVTAATAFLTLGAALYIVAGQLIDLANSLPGYRENLITKAAAFRPGGNSPIKKLTQTFDDVSRELTVEEAPPTAAPPPKDGPEPVPVSVVYQKPSSVAVMKDMSGKLLAPLGTGAMVVVIVVFMLIQRTDLRDRFIHLVGRGRLHVTTQAIDEAGQRVSRYLLAQLIVNVTYGIPIGLGLYFIGIPNAVLWGLLTVVLRFIPYIGPWIAAIFPVVLSFAISPGWWAPVATISLFVVMELVSNNVIEPWLYGQSTGLSPTAIVVSAAFWTWLWGAAGLLLATPLTVCLAVLGKYVPTLGFLDILLGDRPPIAPEQRFYQRVLAGDESELFEIVETYAEKDNLPALFDEVIIPALRQVEQDFAGGLVTREDRVDLIQRVRDALETIDGFSPENPDNTDCVAIVPARSEGDELAGRMLACLLGKRGYPSTVFSHRTLNSELSHWLSSNKPVGICVSVLTGSAARSGEALLRRLTHGRSARKLLGFWWPAVSGEGQETGSYETVRTVADATRLLAEGAPTSTPAPLTAAPQAAA